MRVAEPEPAAGLNSQEAGKAASRYSGTTEPLVSVYAPDLDGKGTGSEQATYSPAAPV